MYFFQRFFDVFWRSLTDKSYYKDIVRARFRFSLIYLFALLFLLSFASTLRHTVWFFQKLPGLSHNFSALYSTISKSYPPELVVSVKDGILKTNVREPFFIDLPAGTLAPLFISDHKHFIVIDTAAKAENYGSYETFLLFTQSSFIFPDENGYREQKFERDSSEFILNKQKYDAFMTGLKPLIQGIEPSGKVLLFFYVLFGPLLGAVFGLIAKLLYLCITTYFMVQISRAVHTDYTYKVLFRLSMHGLTLPILTSFVFGVYGIWIPWVYTLLFMSWMTLVLVYLRDTGQDPKE